MNSWIISGIILLVGGIICLILILRSKWKAGRKNIDDYQRERNKLTHRKKPQVIEVKEYSGSSFSISGIIGGFVAILIGVSLIKPVSEAVNQAQTNVTTSGDTLATTVLGITPIFFALAIVIISIGVVYNSLRSGGLV